MATNLVSSVMQYLTPDLIAKLAPALGIDADVAQKVISAGVPALLASFTNLTATPEGAQQLSDTIKHQNPGFLTQIANAVGGSGQKAIADTGSSLLSALLGGSGMNALASAVSNFAGINQGAGKSLLGLLGPVVIGALGQEQRANGLDAGGLANLLSSQKDQIVAAMPSGLANMLGASGLFDAFSGSLQRGGADAAAAAGRTASATGDAATNATHYLTARASEAAAAATRDGRTSSWPYWLVGIVALLGLLWYLLGQINPQVAEQQPHQQQSKVQMSESSGGRTAALSAANLSADLTSSVDNVRSTLQGITDQASARAALPKLHQATVQIEKINSLAAQLPPSARKGLALLLGSWMPALNQLCDRALSRPEVADVAKPTIEALRTKLEVLAQT
jgi:hypothetical protein